MVRIPIVDENDEVIGEEERSIVHKDGLKHREVHVWLVTDKDEIVFQKRALTKDTFPGLLDASVGGHVDFADETYEEAAMKELEEESGIKDLPIIFFDKLYGESFDSVTNTHNNRFRSTFVARLNRPIEDLVVENNEGEGKALGFESFSLRDLKNLNEESKKKFIPSLVESEWIAKYEKIIEFLNANQS